MGTLIRKALASAVIACVLLTALPARADVQTFNALFFRPATGRNPYLMLQGVDTLHQYQFQVGNFFSYGYRPLEVRQGTTRVTGVIDHSLVSDFVAAFGVAEWAQIGLDFPIVMLNYYQDPNTFPPPGYSNKFSLGDLRLEAKFRIIDACKYPVGVAITPFMTLPTGKDENYAGDAGLTGGLIVSAEGRVAQRFGITGNLGFKTGKKVNFRNLEWQNQLIIGLGMYYEFKDGLSVFGEVNAETAFENFWNDRDMAPVEAIAGVKWDVKKTGIRLNAGFGSCLVCGAKGALARSVIGVTYRWNPPKYQKLDEQFDTVCKLAFQKKGLTAQQYYDLRESCPPNPSDYKPGVDDAACPKYYDLREVAGLLWRCPSKPEDYKAGVHDPACPKVYTLMDQFTPEEIWNVYTLSAADIGARCPQNPVGFNPAIHDQACPKYYELREISYLAGRCPENPEDWKAGVHDDACQKFFALKDQYPPEQWSVITMQSKRDTDRDRINDYLDVCPERPEDYNGFADMDGCPDGGVAAVVGGEILTYRPVTFGFNRYDLDAEDRQIIDIVIGVINKNDWIQRVRVSGNADAIGTPAANDKISRRRAEAVINYMRMDGVRSNVILVPVAYGASRPVASNETEAGRAQNRRVFFAVDTALEGYRPPQAGTPAYRQYPKPAPAPAPAPTPAATQPAAPPPPPPAPAPAPAPEPTSTRQAEETPTFKVEPHQTTGVPARWD